MINIFLIIFSGIIVGRLLRNSRFTKYLGKIISAIIVLLLFFLGMEVGNNEQVMQNFRLIGLDAFVIALAATLGSVLCAWWVYRKFFRRKKEKNA